MIRVWFIVFERVDSSDFAKSIQVYQSKYSYHVVRFLKFFLEGLLLWILFFMLPYLLLHVDSDQKLMSYMKYSRWWALPFIFNIYYAGATWPLSNMQNIQLLGLFSDSENISEPTDFSVHPNTMFKVALLVSQQYNMKIDGHRGVPSGGRVGRNAPPAFRIQLRNAPPAFEIQLRNALNPSPP